MKLADCSLIFSEIEMNYTLYKCFSCHKPTYPARVFRQVNKKAGPFEVVFCVGPFCPGEASLERTSKHACRAF